MEPRGWETERHLQRKEDRFLKGRKTHIHRERGRNRDREKKTEREKETDTESKALRDADVANTLRWREADTENQRT